MKMKKIILFIVEVYNEYTCDWQKSYETKTRVDYDNYIKNKLIQIILKKAKIYL